MPCPNDRPLQRGDYVWLQCGAQRIRAFVALASGNGRSLILMFDGIVDSYVGSLPVLDADGNGTWATLHGTPVTVSPAADDDEGD
jgi:hypothetical protein